MHDDEAPGEGWVKLTPQNAPGVLAATNAELLAEFRAKLDADGSLTEGDKETLVRLAREHADREMQSLLLKIAGTDGEVH